ncbi:MAG: hypothetical protein FJ308_02620 [Planctomycetes bacterium]|nr:hypothetical protein [Planctomycetota bacterium]
MRIAHEVAVRQNMLAQMVESTVRQRLGKERMDLWFGNGATWTAVGDEAAISSAGEGIAPTGKTIRIGVANSFMADCIVKMFRSDLQAAVTQCGGTEWGYEVVVSGGISSPKIVEDVPPQPQITYHEGSSSNGQSSTSSTSISPTVSKPATNISSMAPTQRRTASDVDVQSIASRVVGSPSSSDETPNLRVLRIDAPATDTSVELLRLNAAKPSAVASSHPLRGSHASSDELEMDRLLAVRKQNERRWDDFILGEHNRFAYTGAQMVLERPGGINPLFIHGPHGVGKSHLAQGLAQQLRHQYRMRRVLVLTGEQFTIEYTESARGGGFANFRRKYRDVETLVIDDVQFCLGKSGTLVELRNTIDMLIRDRRQVILVADRGLHEMSGLGSDLYARLSGGMSCSIEPMDVETRQRLLQKLCLKHFVSISDEALDVIAKQCGGDARVLHGIVHRLVAQQRIQGSTLNTDDAIRCTMDLVRASQPIVRLNDIERAVCEAFGLDDEMLRTKTKCQSVSQPRMLAMFLARKYTRTALSEIGEFFGNRQHSTVISAQKKVEQWLTSDDTIQVGRNRVTVREILRSLESNLQVG